MNSLPPLPPDSSSTLTPVHSQQQTISKGKLKYKTHSEKKLEKNIKSHTVPTTYTKVKVYPPYTFGKLTIKKTEELLAAAPQESWLLRYQGNDQTLMIAHKVNGKIEHIPADDIPMAEIKKTYGNKNMVVPDAFKASVNAKLRKFWDVYKGIGKGARPIDDSYRSEVIDTKHRYGGAILDRCFKIWKESKSRDSFSAWLDKVQARSKVPGYDQVEKERLLEMIGKIPKVDYYNEKEREKFRVMIDEEGKLSTKDLGTHFTHSKEDYRFSCPFVVTPEPTIYSGRKIEQQRYHSSFLSGNAVLTAGGLFVENGQILEITDASGHYKPTPDMVLKAVKIFKDQGADLSKAKIVLKSLDEDRRMVFKLDNPETEIKLTQVPEFYGSFNSKAAVSILRGKPPETWLLRHSSNQEANVVSRVNDKKQIEHIILKSGTTIDELKKRFGEDTLLVPVQISKDVK